MKETNGFFLSFIQFSNAITLLILSFIHSFIPFSFIPFLAFCYEHKTKKKTCLVYINTLLVLEAVSNSNLLFTFHHPL